VANEDEGPPVALFDPVKFSWKLSMIFLLGIENLLSLLASRRRAHQATSSPSHQFRQQICPLYPSRNHTLKPGHGASKSEETLATNRFFSRYMSRAFRHSSFGRLCAGKYVHCRLLSVDNNNFHRVGRGKDLSLKSVRV
jgi:hypothetical protein